MSTTIVTDTLLGPSATSLVGALVRITLITSATDPTLPGYGPTGSIVVPVSVNTDTTGAWSAALVPNAQITPANTYYRIEEAGKISNIVVPATGGPYGLSTLLVSPPPTPAAAGITGVQIALDGAGIGVRPALNVITGAGGILSASDNPSLNRVDLTVGSASGSGATPTSRLINTTAPLAGGGNLTADRTLSITAGGIDATLIATALKSPAAGVEGLRTLGTSATAATAGNDSRLTDARTPTVHASTHATAGSDPVSASSIGAATTGHTHLAPPGGPQTLTDAATIATDASLGTHFRVTLGGNRTLANPTNPTDGQKVMWELIQDATGSRTITLGAAFALGTDIATVTLSTAATKRDFLGAVYNATATKWFVIALVKGY